MKLSNINSDFYINLQKNNSLYEFKTELFQNQKNVLDEIAYNKCLFHLPTGFGKTIIGCKLASFINGKILILIPSKIVYNQWLDTIQKYLPTNNITLYMQLKYSKIIKLKSNIQDYKCVIIDECHMNNRLIFEEILPKLNTKYIFGFSATPNIFDFFYQIIIRETKKKFTINIIRLPFSPKISYIYINGRKRLNYTGMMKSLIENNERKIYIQNQLKNIVNNHTEKILILTTNVETTTNIMKDIVSTNLKKIDFLCGNKNKWDQTSDILIGTYQKIGIGFNSNLFGVLILLDNRKDIRQAEGRIRIDNVIIYFLVDKHGVFENHLTQSLDWINSRNLALI